jgi:hypothetical protein
MSRASRRPYDRAVANTTYLRQVVEGYVREQLTEEFSQPFSPKFLPLLPGGRHEFDAVSADGHVVVSIKSASGLTAGGRVPSGKIKDCLAELYYLSLVEAPVRRLVLTTPAFFQLFTRTTVGAVATGIEVACVPLPAMIQAEVDRVVEEASREVSPDRAERAIAADVEGSLDQG